jgi:hypothetical protein
MTANSPLGYNYDLISKTPGGSGSTAIPVAFQKSEYPLGDTDDTQDGTNSLEVLDMLYHRLIWLAHNAADGSDECICDYESAAKAIKLARKIIAEYESEFA